MLQGRWVWTYRILASSGLIGTFSALGFGVTVIVLGANQLNAAAVFSGPISSFQSLPVYFFVSVGTVIALLWMYRSHREIVRRLTLLVATAIVVQAIVLSVVWTPRARTEFLVIDSPTASVLASAQRQIPAGDEVVVSQGVSGRFANRALVFPFLDISDGGQRIPVFGDNVVFVLSTKGIEYASTAGTDTAVAYLQRLGARPIAIGSGVFAFAWHRPPGIHYLDFPSTPRG
jgi:hypothetical protein